MSLGKVQYSLFRFYFETNQRPESSPIGSLQGLWVPVTHYSVADQLTDLGDCHLNIPYESLELTAVSCLDQSPWVSYHFTAVFHQLRKLRYSYLTAGN